MSNIKMVCPACREVNSVDIYDDNESYPCTQCEELLDYPFAVEVTDESCEIHIKENEIPILVDFYSPSCAPCMDMFDDYEGAALGFSLRTRFLKINTDDYQKVAKEHKVSSLPTVIAFKNGKEVNRVNGPLTQYEFSRWAKELIKL